MPSKIFRRDHSKVTDLKSMYKLMRYNDFKNDPSNYNQTCSPPYSPYLAIASRGDLKEPLGSIHPVCGVIMALEALIRK
jgi:hypothetical protein